MCDYSMTFAVLCTHGALITPSNTDSNSSSCWRGASANEFTETHATNLVNGILEFLPTGPQGERENVLYIHACHANTKINVHYVDSYASKFQGYLSTNQSIILATPQ